MICSKRYKDDTHHPTAESISLGLEFSHMSDAASTGLPDQLGLALRNAAMLDPTWDCIVRVPPGSVVSVIGSGLTKLCATKEAKGSWNDFVRSATYKYGNEYSALLAKLAVQLLSH